MDAGLYLYIYGQTTAPNKSKTWSGVILARFRHRSIVNHGFICATQKRSLVYPLLASRLLNKYGQLRKRLDGPF